MVKAVKSIAIAFPLVIAACIPIRLFLLPRLFSKDELEALDGDDSHAPPAAVEPAKVELANPNRTLTLTLTLTLARTRTRTRTLTLTPTLALTLAKVELQVAGDRKTPMDNSGHSVEEIGEHVDPPAMRCSPSATNLLTEDGDLPRSH